jgi:Fe2+ or Zn2+ uptake regulation protein
MDRSNAIVEALDLAGYQLTAPRRALASLIQAYGGHFTASELERCLRAPSIG